MGSCGGRCSSRTLMEAEQSRGSNYTSQPRTTHSLGSRRSILPMATACGRGGSALVFCPIGLFPACGVASYTPPGRRRRPPITARPGHTTSSGSLALQACIMRHAPCAMARREGRLCACVRVAWWWWCGTPRMGCFAWVLSDDGAWWRCARLPPSRQPYQTPRSGGGDGGSRRSGARSGAEMGGLFSGRGMACFGHYPTAAASATSKYYIG
jgi:hypothetical protein